MYLSIYIYTHLHGCFLSSVSLVALKSTSRLIVHIEGKHRVAGNSISETAGNAAKTLCLKVGYPQISSSIILDQYIS